MLYNQEIDRRAMGDKPQAQTSQGKLTPWGYRVSYMSSDIPRHSRVAHGVATKNGPEYPARLETLSANGFRT